MTNVLLGIIAASVLVMAVIQISVFFAVARATRGAAEAFKRLEQDVRPIVANLNAMSGDAARATALAAGQVERADQLINTLSKKVEDTVVSFQTTVLQPARDALSLVGALRGAMSAFRAASTAAAPRSDDHVERTPGTQSGPARDARTEPRAAGDDEDTLFVG